MTLQIVGQLKKLRPKHVKGTVLNKDDDGTLASIETIPKRKFNIARNGFLSRDVFDNAELLKLPHNEVVGEDTTPVLTL